MLIHSWDAEVKADEMTYDGLCFEPVLPYRIEVLPKVPRESTGGLITYRWHVNGAVTDPSTARYTWDNQFGEILSTII